MNHHQVQFAQAHETCQRAWDFFKQNPCSESYRHALDSWKRLCAYANSLTIDLSDGLHRITPLWADILRYQPWEQFGLPEQYEGSFKEWSVFTRPWHDAYVRPDDMKTWMDQALPVIERQGWTGDDIKALIEQGHAKKDPWWLVVASHLAPDAEWIDKEIKEAYPHFQEASLIESSFFFIDPRRYILSEQKGFREHARKLTGSSFQGHLHELMDVFKHQHVALLESMLNILSPDKIPNPYEWAKNRQMKLLIESLSDWVPSDLRQQFWMMCSPLVDFHDQTFWNMFNQESQHVSVDALADVEPFLPFGWDMNQINEHVVDLVWNETQKSCLEAYLLSRLVTHSKPSVPERPRRL